MSWNLKSFLNHTKHLPISFLCDAIVVLYRAVYHKLYYCQNLRPTVETQKQKSNRTFSRIHRLLINFPQIHMNKHVPGKITAASAGFTSRCIFVGKQIQENAASFVNTPVRERCCAFAFGPWTKQAADFLLCIACLCPCSSTPLHLLISSQISMQSVDKQKKHVDRGCTWLDWRQEVVALLFCSLRINKRYIYQS